MYTEV